MQPEGEMLPAPFSLGRKMIHLSLSSDDGISLVLLLAFGVHIELPNLHRIAD